MTEAATFHTLVNDLDKEDALLILRVLGMLQTQQDMQEDSDESIT